MNTGNRRCDPIEKIKGSQDDGEERFNIYSALGVGSNQLRLYGQVKDSYTFLNG